MYVMKTSSDSFTEKLFLKDS